MSTKTPKCDNDEGQTVWLWAAAITAWMVGCNPEGPKDVGWHGYSEELTLARFCLHRALNGPTVLDEIAAAYKDDVGEALEFPKPKDFVSWKQTAAALFAQLPVDPDVTKLRVGQAIRWSPYHLLVVRDTKDKLYDERVKQPLPEGMVASFQEYGRNTQPVLVGVRGKDLVVGDGRFRTRSAIEANWQTLVEWYGRIEFSLDSGQGLIEDAATPPRLIYGVDCVVRSLHELQLLKAISNASGLRTNETVLQEARCAWELAALGKTPPQIAALRGTTSQTIRNYLSLKKVIASFIKCLADGSVTMRTGYRLAGESKTRQTAVWKHLQKFEEEAKKKEAKTNFYVSNAFIAELKKKRDQIVQHWLDGAPEQPELPGVPPALAIRERAATHDRLEVLHGHLKRLPPSATVDGLRQLVAALLGDKEQLEKLPPVLRAGVTNAWGAFMPKERDRWNGLGVWDPKTAKLICSAEPRRDEVVPGLRNFEEVCSKAALPWKDGLTLGAAVEAGHLTPARFWQLAQQEQLALSPAGQLPAATTEGPRVPPPATGPRVPSPKRGQKATTQSPMMWGQYPREQWEAAEVFDERLARELAAELLTPQDLAERDPTVVGGERFLTFGHRFTRRLITIPEIKAALLARETPPIETPPIEDVDASEEAAARRATALSVVCTTCAADVGQVCESELGGFHLARLTLGERARELRAEVPPLPTGGESTDDTGPRPPRDPLSAAAIDSLRNLTAGPKPRQEMNPGVAGRLEREALAIVVDIDTPYKKGPAKVRALQITPAGFARLQAIDEGGSIEADPLAVECPSCEAPAGERCKGGEGAPHLMRKVKATKEAPRRRQAEAAPEVHRV